jgi:hypothetical protein
VRTHAESNDELPEALVQVLARHCLVSLVALVAEGEADDVSVSYLSEILTKLVGADGQTMRLRWTCQQPDDDDKPSLVSLLVPMLQVRRMPPRAMLYLPRLLA